MIQTGLAKQQFFETYPYTPWLKAIPSFQKQKWPLLEELLAKKQLSYLNYYLTHRLLRDLPIGQECALFICHLLMAAKEGHLCVQIENNRLYPSVEQIWPQEGELSLSSEKTTLLTSHILQGAKQLPPSLITFMGKNHEVKFPYTPFCSFQNSFYLQRHWVYETLFLNNLKRHVQTPPSLEINKIYIEEQLNRLKQQGVLLEEQAQAIRTGCLSSLSLIRGGPGTGKTYTAGHLIKIFWDSLNEEQKLTCQIVLAAPTGKAAANLQKSLSKVIGNLKGVPILQAKTLHALLGIQNSSAFESNARLTADLIIIDESSMMDVKMMAILFEALKKGSRLIMLGDPNQLPSVEAGSLFVDLINIHQALSIPCTELKTCLRAELSTIINFATMINQGEWEQVITFLKEQRTPGISRLSLPPEIKAAQRAFLSHVMHDIPSIIKDSHDQEGLLNLFNGIRILSPMRKGPFGVVALNEIIWQHISQQRQTNGWLAIPIMIITNDYGKDLFNGETGVLMRKLPLKGLNSEDYALFPSRSQGENIRRLSALMLPRYEHAYCLSVHKSQGSEFDKILLVLPEGSELFGRGVFYTAVTRARKHIEVYGSDSIIQKTIEQQGIRLSGIERRLLAIDLLHN